MPSKIKWKYGKSSYEYYCSDVVPGFEITSYGSGYELEYHHQQHFDTLQEAKQWAEDFRLWKRKRRNKP